MSTYQIWTYLRTRSKHQLALSVGVVNLTGQQGGQLVGPAYGLVQQTLSIASTETQKRVRVRVRPGQEI